MESLGQNPVGALPVHATTASGRTETVSPSSSTIRAVLEAVAITTQAEPSSPSSANSVTQTDPLAAIGTALILRELFRADAGATRTLPETAKTGAAQGMYVKNGRDESAHLTDPVVSTKSRR